MQNQVINFVKNHKTGAIAGVIAFSSLLIYHFTNAQDKSFKQKTKKKYKTNEDKSKFNKQQQEINNQILKLKRTRQIMVQKSKNFQVQYIPDKYADKILSQECILNLYDVCIDVIDQQQLNNIYNLSRTARRSIFNRILPNTNIRSQTRRDSLLSVEQNITRKQTKNLASQRDLLTFPQVIRFSELYYRYICTNEEEFRYLIEKTQKIFASFLDIDFEVITGSIDYHMEKQNNEFFKSRVEQWTSSIRQNLKNKLDKYTDCLNPKLIEEILTYQISFLREKKQRIVEMIHKLRINDQQELECLPTFLDCLLQDAVWQKFEVQQQQMAVDVMHLSKNKQLQALVKQFQQLAGKIVEEMYEQVQKPQIMEDSDYF